MSDWEQDALKWRKNAIFGVEIDRDFSHPFNAEEADAFRNLINSYGLVVARGQKLAMRDQVNLLSLLGKVVRRVDGIGYMTSEAGHDAALSELTFHSDYAFGPNPLEYLSLCAVDVVDGASSTRFANAEIALRQCSDAIKSQLDGRQVDTISPNFGAVSGRACDMREPDAALRNDRPAILQNPRSGAACLGTSEMHSAKIVDMDWEESRTLLNQIHAIIYDPANIYEHVWHKGDIVIWDNQTVQHARGSLTKVGKRVLQRVAVGQKSLWEMFPEEYPDTEPFYPEEALAE